MPPPQIPEQPPVALERCASLYLICNTAKGRGVFAREEIRAGTIIEICPVLILDPTENREHIEKTSLYHYTYNWPISNSSEKATRTQAVVFGLGSMFNHSSLHQNVGWQRDVPNELVIYRALRDIAQGEELCISYGDHLTFEDADKPDLDAELETEDDVLNRIELGT